MPEKSVACPVYNWDRGVRLLSRQRGNPQQTRHKMYTVEINGTNDYNCEYANRLETWLLGSVGICERTEDAAIAEARIHLITSEFEEGVFYTISARKIEEE